MGRNLLMARFRADLGTLAAFARLPGGHRVRTLTPLLMSEAFASNSWMQPQCVWLQELGDGICRVWPDRRRMEGMRRLEIAHNFASGPHRSASREKEAVARRSLRLCVANCSPTKPYRNRKP